MNAVTRFCEDGSVSDWRLNGQEKYLTGVNLIHRRYRRYPKDTTWDHDHCEFCAKTFTVEDFPDTIQVGYATEDDYRWICETCFAEFKDRFGWVVIADEAF
jgi:hypothetical protein